MIETEPELTEAQNVDETEVNLNRWTKGDEDRLYVNGISKDAYVDLNEMEVCGAGVTGDVEGGVATIEYKTGWSGNWTEKKIVIDLTPSDEDDEEDVETEEVEENEEGKDSDDIDPGEFDLSDDEEVEARYYDPDKDLVQEQIEAPAVPGATTMREINRDGDVKEYGYSRNWIAEHLREGEWERVEGVSK